MRDMVGVILSTIRLMLKLFFTQPFDGELVHCYENYVKLKRLHYEKFIINTRIFRFLKLYGSLWKQ